VEISLGWLTGIAWINKVFLSFSIYVPVILNSADDGSKGHHKMSSNAVGYLVQTQCLAPLIAI
jgi:hypothetical protein